MLRPMPEIDYAQMAQASSREAFLRAYPFPFLLGDDRLQRPVGPRVTAFLPAMGEVTPSHGRPLARPSVGLAVRKIRDTFPDMITVGRTPNNDVHIPDVSVSKFHAYFRLAGADRILIADAGSRNGTLVEDRPLVARAAPIPVEIGNRICFGSVGLVLVDAGRFWDAITVKRPAR